MSNNDHDDYTVELLEPAVNKNKKRSKKMKNKNVVVYTISAVFVVLFVACLIAIFANNKKVVCTMKSDQSKSGYVYETKYVINAKGNNVKTVKVTETITSDKSKLLKKFEKQFKDQYAFNKKTYGGYTYDVVNKDGKVVSTVTINYRDMDMKKFIKNNEAMKKYTENEKFTLDGAKKLYESSGAKCK